MHRRLIIKQGQVEFFPPVKKKISEIDAERYLAQTPLEVF